MIDDDSEDFRLEVVPDRSAQTLEQAIKNHVERDTTILTDEWRGYSYLNNLGYDHHTVNHSVEYVTRDGVNTQRIESCWRSMRAFFKDRQIPQERFADTVVEYQWRRWNKKSNNDPFDKLIQGITNRYVVL